MNIQIRANQEQKDLLQSKQVTANIIWYNNQIEAADAYVDLLFTTSDDVFASITNKTVIVNELAVTLQQLPSNYSRINGWHTFLEKDKLEVATNDETWVSEILRQLGYQYIIVPDITGLISARNIAMIINEAFFALEDNISTKEQIDTAMKLGTNYPFGPFEWGDKIGMQKIKSLLQELSKTDERYTPCNLLLQY